MKNKPLMFKWTVSSVAVLVLLAGYQMSASRPKFQKHEESRPLFGTTIILSVCYDEPDAGRLPDAFRAVWQRLDEMQWRMNIRDERSDVAKVNRSGGEPVLIAEDTYRLLKYSLAYSKLTGGVFDITVFPLIQHWKQAAQENRMPAHAALEEARRMTGMHHLEFLGSNRVRLRNPQARIDLDGIAAGFGADEAARIFKEHGFWNFLVDTGGELFASGSNCEGHAWRVGIRNPRDPSRLIDVVRLSNEGVSTSGNYEKYYDIEGQRLSHVINPVTGYPQKDVVSATVIAPSATAADALSTAVSVLGAKAGMDFIDSLGGGFAAVAVWEEGGRLRTGKSSRFYSTKLSADR